MVTPFESRTALLVGEEGIAALKNAHVILFGVGGVGGYVAEALARAGVGRLTLVDDDVVAESNLNRQLIALTSTVGQPKVEAAAQRIRQINPQCEVRPVALFYTPETAAQLPFEGASYVVDAVDTVTAKLCIIGQARQVGVPVISSMGTGNKLHPELLRLATIEKTEGCPLAKVMRKECKARGYKKVQVVYSPEPPIRPRPVEVAAGSTDGADAAPARPGSPKKQTPGSVSFVPGAAGLMIAGAVVRGILGLD